MAGKNVMIAIVASSLGSFVEGTDEMVRRMQTATHASDVRNHDSFESSKGRSPNGRNNHSTIGGWRNSPINSVEGHESEANSRAMSAPSYMFSPRQARREAA
jgi:hypothetical protein